MPAKIFVSCGQKHERERAAAAAVKAMLEGLGFDVYVAIQAQSIEDVNSGIIRHLERSDYYLFVDFRREDLVDAAASLWHRRAARGSLFTHQELAVAYVFGFQDVLFFQEPGVQVEGLLAYLGANPIPFESNDELVASVCRSVGERWSVNYSRSLVAPRLRWSDGVIVTPRLNGRFLYVDVENRRRYEAALDTILRLEFISARGGARHACRDRSLLKVTGQPGFSQAIWPLSWGAFDLLMVDSQHQASVYLYSALDVPPQPIIQGVGQYTLDYAVLARGFPVLHFSVDLNLTGSIWATTATLCGNES
jgi:hypothetical protein